jgi:SAM-dependent methyltransferase
LPTYAILTKPSTNRLYARQTIAVGQAELLTVTALALATTSVGAGTDGRVRTRVRHGVPYLELDTEAPLDDDARAVLANLSVTYALFEVTGDALVPIGPGPVGWYDDDLLTILRYSGKTNEQFTQLLVNLALAAAGSLSEVLGGGRARVLDPLCGRGTTLNQVLMYGADAVGIEADRKETDQYAAFLRRWLQEHRVKHRADLATMRHQSGPTARALTVDLERPAPSDGIGSDAPVHRQTVEVITDDTTNARDHIKRSSVDAVVADLPYGVQHGARTAQWGSSRNPLELLAAALPVWRQVLRPGGAMALAYNTRVVRPQELHGHLEMAGLELIDPPDDASFRHEVDRSITRDVALARRPS